MANVMIMVEKENPAEEDEDTYFLLDKDDVIEFAQELRHASSEEDIIELQYDTTLISGIKTTISISIDGGYKDSVTITIDQRYTIPLPKDIINAFAECIKEAYIQAGKMHEANENLQKVMTKLRDDMKAEKVHSLYFDLLPDIPRLFENQTMDINRIYEITARDINKKPLYSFLRIMHLTGIESVDYRDRGKEFLGCPFEYSDNVKTRGKNLIERQKQALHTYVDNKTGETTKS
jgi:hypothetical protein